MVRHVTTPAGVFLIGVTKDVSFSSAQEGKVLQDAAALRPGDRVTARLARGRFTAEVLAVEPPPPHDAETGR